MKLKNKTKKDLNSNSIDIEDFVSAKPASKNDNT